MNESGANGIWRLFFYSQQHYGKTDQSLYTNQTKYIRLTTTFHLTLMMTSAQVVETSVTITDNSPSQDYTHSDDQTTLFEIFNSNATEKTKICPLILSGQV